MRIIKKAIAFGVVVGLGIVAWGVNEMTHQIEGKP